MILEKTGVDYRFRIIEALSISPLARKIHCNQHYGKRILGTHRFQHAVSASRLIVFQRADCHHCTLEAMRTQAMLPDLCRGYIYIIGNLLRLLFGEKI
jgi:hypothetical protein